MLPPTHIAGMLRAMTLYEMELAQYQKPMRPQHSQSRPNATTKHSNRRSASTSRAFALKLLDQQLSRLPLLMQPGGFFLFPALAVEGGEALEDFDAGGFGNRVADIVVRGKIADLVETVL